MYITFETQLSVVSFVPFKYGLSQSWGLRPVLWQDRSQTGLGLGLIILALVLVIVLVLYFWSWCWSWSRSFGLGLSLGLGLAACIRTQKAIQYLKRFE